MFKGKLTPRTNKRINKRQSSQTIAVPDNWVDFASGCKIRSGTKIVNFVPYKYQAKLIEHIEKHKLNVIAKTRQLGITETISNYFLWKALKNAAYLAVIFSKGQSDTSNIAKRLRRQIEALGAKTSSDSLQDIEFKNGGRILFRNSTANGARGLESVSDILFDEAAFIDEISEIYKSALPCTTMVGDAAKIIINSTPAGQAGFFFEKLTSGNGDRDVLQLCESIKQGTSDPAIFWSDSTGAGKCLLHWKAHPKFSKNPNYLADIESQYGLSHDMVQQEYNLSFVSGDTLVFSPELVRNAAIGEKEAYSPRYAYYIGIDTALQGDDYTVATVLKWDNDTQSMAVADWYRRRQTTSELNLFNIMELCDKFPTAVIGVEINGAGQLYYERLYSSLPSSQIEKIVTTQDSKAGMISRLILALEKGVLQFPSKSPYPDELLSFRANGKKLEAIAGKHDDCVMSLAFAVAISPFKPLTSPNLIRI